MNRYLSASVQKSFSDDHRTRHVFMPFAAEYVTRKSEPARLVGRESDMCDFPRVDVRVNPKPAQVESVLAILGRQHQHNWLALFQGDRVRCEFEFLRGYVNLSFCRQRIRAHI